MKIKCVKLDCEVCGKVSAIQLFYRSNGELAYGRARHYTGRTKGKPQFTYHQQTLAYLQRKLNQIPKSDNLQIVGQIGQEANIDLYKANSSTILENMWASSSARIEHQPSKLRVKGSNPFPPATQSLIGAQFCLLLVNIGYVTNMTNNVLQSLLMLPCLAYRMVSGLCCWFLSFDIKN
jgi:hypothetical protein